MKYQVTRFKNLAIALKELEPFVRDPRHLLTGKRLKRFGGMLPRELLANWLLCAVLNAGADEDLDFTSDPIGGDGVVVSATTGQAWPTEHVVVAPPRGQDTDDVEQRILASIASKNAKGRAAYANGKTLIVFLYATGSWFPNKVARQLPQPLHFASVLVVGLHAVEEGAYLYNAVQLDTEGGDAPVRRVRISPDFTAWGVEDVQ